MLRTTVWSWTEWRVCLRCVTAPWNSLRRSWGVSLTPNSCTTSSTPSLQSPQTNQQNQPKVTSNEGSNGNVDKPCVNCYSWILKAFEIYLTSSTGSLTGNDANMLRIRFWDNLFIAVKTYCLMIFCLFSIKKKYNLAIN